MDVQALKIGQYVRARDERTGRITRVDAVVAEVAWFPGGAREWMLLRDLRQADHPAHPFGWEIAVRMGHPTYEERTFYWRGLSESAARRRALQKGQGVTVLSILPVSREEWVRGFGDPDIQGETRKKLS